MSLQFAFPNRSIDGRFTQVSKAAVAAMVTKSLGELCNAQLRPWRCSAGSSTPGLRFELTQQGGEWFVQLTLAHDPSRPDLTDTWKECLFDIDYLTASTLPMNDAWVTPIRETVRRMLKGSGENGRSILATLRETVPLGTDVAMIPSNQVLRPSAVLPLLWNDYKDFANWRYRIVYRSDAGEITIHAGGAGRDTPFKRGADAFPGLLVIHDTYQLGSLGSEPIGAHLQELEALVPVAFYVERFVSAPADVSVVP